MGWKCRGKEETPSGSYFSSSGLYPGFILHLSSIPSSLWILMDPGPQLPFLNHQFICGFRGLNTFTPWDWPSFSHSLSNSSMVAFGQSWIFLSPVSIWKCVEAFLVFTMIPGYYRHLGSGVRSAQECPTLQRIVSLQVPVILSLRNTMTKSSVSWDSVYFVLYSVPSM